MHNVTVKDKSSFFLITSYTLVYVVTIGLIGAT